MMGNRVAVLVLALAACGGDSTVPTGPSGNPDEPAGRTTGWLGISRAMGTNVGVSITWRAGTTDSITFTATTAGTADTTGSLAVLPPFSGVDVLVLGSRPAAGVTVAWDVVADYWWTDRGVSVNGTAALGTVQYTEPQPAGEPPDFDSLPPPDTTGAPPAATVIELVTWPDSVTVAPGETVQFCALARLSDDPAKWVALPSATVPVPAVCVLAAQSRNSPSGGGSVG